MIANQVARIPITPKLSRHLVGHLPTQCMLQLLKSHAFAKNKLHTKVRYIYLLIYISLFFDTFYLKTKTTNTIWVFLMPI